MGKLKMLLMIVILFSMISCGNKQAQKELLTIEAKLNTLLKENAALQEQLGSSDDHQGDLVHYVFLDVKDDVSANQYKFLIKEIKSIAKIDVVKDFEIGRYENMDDDRELENRDINFKMRFSSKKNYYTYQKSKEHMRVRELLSPFLTQAPLTYDYIIQ